ncbi:MAG: hypothetical protein JO107_11655, partial [Hyphomicrobiales bacterium]|nr:hypothetical protein [Hyphomicrobiales bacterium]
AAGRESDLAVINPSLILGPLLDEDPGTSAIAVTRLLNGTVPAAPRLAFAIVDVRDVAAAHVAALADPKAGGRRFPTGGSTMLLKRSRRCCGGDSPSGQANCRDLKCRTGGCASMRCSTAT